MPLPNFDDFRVVWVEKTKARHGHGGEGYLIDATWVAAVPATRTEVCRLPR
jgi:hypothetical protein